MFHVEHFLFVIIVLEYVIIGIRIWRCVSMGKTIAVFNQKGGVGKTTTAVHLAYWFAQKGQRVLLVDLDMQGHACFSLGVEKSNSAIKLFNGFPL